MSGFLGTHVGRNSLRVRIVEENGYPTALAQRRFQKPQDLPEALESAFTELSGSPAWGGLAGAAIGLDKAQRPLLPPQVVSGWLPQDVPLLMLPAQLAILLGAVPSGPSLLVSLGIELRFAAVDSTNTYRDYRLQEGGGGWWTQELPKLAKHSPRLSQAIAPHDTRQKLMKALPRLLEMGDFPAPDPVLKIRLDGLCESISESCLGLATRLPGVQSMSLAGFLNPSAMSERICAGCAGHLRLHNPRFPAEVGAALLAFALYKENQERRHLDKPLETGQLPPDRWSAAPVLLRRIYRTRRPFDRFPEAVTP